jgi:hypothetical protein
MVSNPEKQVPLKSGIAIQSSTPLYTQRHHNLQNPERNHKHDEQVNQD